MSASCKHVSSRHGSRTPCHEAAGVLHSYVVECCVHVMWEKLSSPVSHQTSSHVQAGTENTQVPEKANKHKKTALNFPCTSFSKCHTKTGVINFSPLNTRLSRPTSHELSMSQGNETEHLDVTLLIFHECKMILSSTRRCCDWECIKTFRKDVQRV